MAEDLLALLKERGALLEGHFRLSSGLHSSQYLQCARVLMDPALATRLGADLPLEGALALEREAVWRLFMSDDAAEGLAAFAEKRQPNWKGH